MKKNNRVVITGLGVVSSIGIGWEEFWKNLIAGKSGISKITSFDASQHDRHYGGEVKDFDPTQFMSRKKASSMGRASQMAIAASKLAMRDGGMLTRDLVASKTGVSLGTTMGEPQVMERLDTQCFSNGRALRISDSSAISYPASSISGNVGFCFNFQGENTVFANACAAGNYTVTRSYDLIKPGKIDIMLAGGVDALSRVAFTGFGRLFAMAPQKCQPFDKSRKGMLLGEGAAVVLLESLQNAKKRKAKIYAEILGYGLSCDAHHMTNPSMAGVKKAMRKSIDCAGVDPNDIDYISAHGTGTKENDKTECSAMRTVFGKRTKKIPISSIKSMLGHTMGAAAAFETIACSLAIDQGIIPPTINHEQTDPACDIDCVPNKARKTRVHIALNNSQAFGGNNACLVLGKS